MADTNPVASGSTTSEGKGSKLVVILASVIATLGTISTVLETLTAIIPPAQKGLGLYLAVGGAVVAAVTQIAYTVQRGWVKVEAIKAGAAVDTSASDPSKAAANLGR